jgi:UPF0716 family protein affecting phage T7 exclusion
LPLGALAALVLFGDDLGPARALAVATAFLAVGFGVLTASGWWVLRRESRAADNR